MTVELDQQPQSELSPRSCIIIRAIRDKDSLLAGGLHIDGANPEASSNDEYKLVTRFDGSTGHSRITNNEDLAEAHLSKF